MKIAIISDIHGNKIALEAVLDDILKNKVEHIIVLGDLITDLPNETNSVLDMVKSLRGFIIKGNRESYILNNQEPFEYDHFLAMKLTKNLLTEENYNYIKSLPEQISLIFDSEFSLRCVHGSPFSIFEHINENDDKSIINCQMAINEKILLCGHTHKQWFRIVNGKTVINPGSVGINFSGDKTAQYAIIENELNGIQIELMKIKYDFTSFKKSCDLDIPWVRLCVKGMEDGIEYTMNFLREAKAKNNEWPISNDTWNNLYKEWCKKKII